MSVTYADSYTYLTASAVASLAVPYPVNISGSNPQSGQLMVCLLSFTSTTAATAAMAGWDSGPTIGNTYSFTRQGDGNAGNGTIVFTGDTVYVTAIILLFNGTSTVTALDGSSTSTTGGSNHAVNSFNTSIPNGLLLIAFAGSTNWTQFSYAGAGQILQFAIAVPKNFGPPTPLIPFTVSYDPLAGIGPTNARLCVSSHPQTGLPVIVTADGLMMALRPYEGPSPPNITAPVDAETITIGRTYSITWTASTDPNIAQSALTYGLDYSLNDGLTWTVITAATSAGAVTHAWNTTGLIATPQAKLRIRSFNGTEFSAYDTTGRITLATDVTPGAPISCHGEQPDGTTVTLFDRTLVLLVKGTFSDLGDVMTGYQLDWGTDGVTYGAASGTVTTSVFSHSFPLATFANGLVYFRARTKDTAGTFGPYAFFTLTAATPPAAPNITAPTAGSPPTAPLPTITWTSTGQTHYKITITQGGTTRYAGSFVTSSALSITSPFPFLNDTLYTLTLVYKDSSGLTSPADNETFTVSFLGPATPLIDVS